LATYNEFRSHDEINDRYLWGLLEHARSILARAREMELARYDISMEQMSVLHALLICGGSATFDEIARVTIRQVNSVSTLVNRMKSSGLVDKEKIKYQKKYRISLTQKAQDIISSVPNKSPEMIFAKLAPQDKEKMATYLEQLIVTGRDILGLNYVPPFLSDQD
jgi:DNA-binding MarR family transcriptional regulator